MIYYVKILNMRKKQYQYVCHYDSFSNELLLTDNRNERQEYFSKESLLADLAGIIENIDVKKNQLIICAY